MTRSTTFDVIAFGETMAMMVADDPGELAEVTRFTKRIAGADNNVAIGLARLGLTVGWVSRVGDDSFGRFIRQTLASEGLDVSRLSTDERHPTGFQLKSRRDDGGDPAVEYFRRGSAASHMGPEDVPESLLSSARHLHCTGIPPALGEGPLALSEHAMKTMRRVGGSVSFDPNLRPSLWKDRETMRHHLNRLASLADVVLPGLSEGEILTGESTPQGVAEFYLSRGVREVVIKLGPEGAWYQNDSTGFMVPGVKVDRVVDTVGAGDGFATGFVSAWLEGLPAEQCVARANQIGAFAVQVSGDMEGLPTRDALERAMAS
ncbi:sugar kinase [Larsenimonas suaedae]|uniref:Sugar kinase n=1 Tax=Larsenimonas suaedae TaxID=1851019 RepID=A0ABU1GVQ6_9GAMM|nr:sugar kinase [Larsenimonas suaedae]MCM2973241.1 sugar kinase [Larsenimonas suaedae]MDR5896134.1 sugar kinase [Larsenimonas suaedae]